MSLRILVIGGSRGLGRELVKKCLTRNDHVDSVSRTNPEGMANHLRLDMSRSEDCDKLCEKICENDYDYIFYVAAGGPFGPFEEKKWSSHLWALKVSLTSAMQVMHTALQAPRTHFVAIGSLVAEFRADPGAASYAAAKSGLAGLMMSVVAEQGSDRISLISPGYMDTPMLPKNAWPRQHAAGILSPEQVADEILHWLSHRNGQWRLELPDNITKLDPSQDSSN